MGNANVSYSRDVTAVTSRDVATDAPLEYWSWKVTPSGATRPSKRPSPFAKQWAAVRTTS
jgi:hypothetical protein